MRETDVERATPHGQFAPGGGDSLGELSHVVAGPFLLLVVVGTYT